MPSDLAKRLGINIAIDEGWIPSPVRHFEQGHIALRGLRIDVRHIDWSLAGVRVVLGVLDRDTNEPLEIRFDVHFDSAPQSAQHMAELIERAVAQTVAHEVAERLYIDGKRHDPHAPNGPRYDASRMWFERELPGRRPPPLVRYGMHVDELTVCTRSQLLELFNKYRGDLGCPPLAEVDIGDEELRDVLRSLRRAASTAP